MKRTLTLLTLILCAVMSDAQITLVSADMPAVGWVNAMQKDTSTGTLNWGNRGANQIYDFSALQNNEKDSLFYLAPTSAQTTAIPGATGGLAITGDHSTYIFAKNASTLYDYVGGQTTYSGTTLLTPFSPVDTGFKFATAYGQNFHGTYGFTTTQPGSAFGQPTIYEVRITNTTTYTDTIDGWGTVKTPVGTYKCLRQHRIEHSSTLLEYKLFSFSSWSNVPTSSSLPANPIVSTTNSYNYLTKETHGTVISFTYDASGNPQTASWSTTPPVPVADFGYTNGSAGLVTFRDSSTGAPLTYSWNFGDGSALSTSANPTHTYSTSGTYYVCQTVTNVSGNNTVCDSVHVTIAAITVPPLAVNDTASVVQPGTVTIPVVANDINNNPGDTLCITTIWGAPSGWATVSGCSGITFHPLSAGYTGLDTFYYKVCDIHIPTLCDTAMVVVNVKAAAVVAAPVAVNDAASVLQPGTVVIHAVANDINNNPGDTLCISSVWGVQPGWATVQGCSDISFHALDSNYTGADTFYYKVCDLHLPTHCDTGMVVVSVTEAFIPPVAGFTVQPVLCSGRTFTNTSVGADSIWWRFTELTPTAPFDTTIGGHNTLAIANGTAPFAGNTYVVCLTARNTAGLDQKCDTVAFTCLGIGDIAASALSIYPNPATHEIKVDLSDAALTGFTSIEVYSLLGEKLITVPSQRTTAIDISSLSNGVYVIQLSDKANSRKMLGKFEVVR